MSQNNYVLSCMKLVAAPSIRVYHAQLSDQKAEASISERGENWNADRPTMGESLVVWVSSSPMTSSIMRCMISGFLGFRRALVFLIAASRHKWQVYQLQLASSHQILGGEVLMVKWHSQISLGRRFR